MPTRDSEWIDFHDAENSVVSLDAEIREGEIIVFIVNANAGGALRATTLALLGPGFYRKSSIPMPRLMARQQRGQSRRDHCHRRTLAGAGAFPSCQPSTLATVAL